MHDEIQKKAILARLKRIEGQVRGVQRMIEEDRECYSIAQQLQSIRSAVQSANQELIQTYLTECVTSSDLPAGKVAEISRVFGLLD